MGAVGGAGGLAVAQTGVDTFAEMMGKAGDFTAGGVAHGFNLVKFGDIQLNWVIGEERDMRDERDERIKAKG